MRVEFDENEVLHVVPETSTEAMAMRYWKNEYDEHGDKLLNFKTEVPGNPGKKHYDSDD